MLLRIGDFNFDIKNEYDYIPANTKDYAAEFDLPDYSFKVKESEIETERKLALDWYSNRYLEYICAYRIIAEWLPLNNAFLLHSAVFDVDGIGVAFAAHSGTGKTTHMNLWQQLLGDKMTVVNGDKPIIRYMSNEQESPYAYGTPWNGKEHLGCNMKTELKHICFIERAEKNSCEPMEAKDAIDLMFNQVYMPKNPMAVMNTMSLINRLLSSCKLWKIKCNMDPEAAEVAYNTIFNLSK